MKVIIAGSRDIDDAAAVYEAIHDSGFKITEVVCGEAKGVDTIGKEWAEDNDIPVKSFPADWRTYGAAAGPLRNKAMAEYADALIVVHKDSPGSRNMIEQAKGHNLRIYEVRFLDKEQHALKVVVE